MQSAERFTNLPPYTPIEPFEVLSARLGRPPEEIVKLDANENPYGPSPIVRSALASLEFPHIYPDPESRILRAALADFTGVPAENLLAGSGADELIDLLLRVMLEKDDIVVNCPPTFGMYPFDTRLNAGSVIDIPRRADFSLDLPAIQNTVATRKPQVLFVTAPNNPDGRFPTQDEFETLLELPVLVVIDEAYIEFCQEGGRLGQKRTHLNETVNRENLVVLRTFSKWAGLAGLRIGYGAFPTWMMPILWKAKQPYNVNVAASTAAIASLRDLEYLTAVVERIKTERQRLFTQLSQVPFLRPFPSEANFILCQVLKPLTAVGIKSSLMEQGIMIRYYNTPLLQDYIRVSVGKPEHTDRLMIALTELSTHNELE
jgi:histidinol-phosphate aminotransferase